MWRSCPATGHSRAPARWLQLLAYGPPIAPIRHPDEGRDPLVNRSFGSTVNTGLRRYDGSLSRGQSKSAARAVRSVEIVGEGGADRLGQRCDMPVIGMVEANQNPRARLFEPADLFA